MLLVDMAQLFPNHSPRLSCAAGGSPAFSPEGFLAASLTRHEVKGSTSLHGGTRNHSILKGLSVQKPTLEFPTSNLYKHQKDVELSVTKLVTGHLPSLRLCLDDQPFALECRGKKATPAQGLQIK